METKANIEKNFDTWLYLVNNRDYIFDYYALYILKMMHLQQLVLNLFF